MDINASVALPKHEFRAFGNDEFTAEEMAEIQRQLEEDIPFDHLNFREGPSGTTVAYVASHYIVEEANRIFGQDAWSSEVKELVEDYCTVDEQQKYSLGYSALMRITLKSGKYVEDVGSGSAENMHFLTAKSNAQKGAITDALKRYEEKKRISVHTSTMLRFGRRLGTCLKDPEYIAQALQYEQDH